MIFKCYNNIDFQIQKMSLIRNSSRKQFSITPQDLASCLDQKNSMIAILQAEVEDLRFNHQKYQRLLEQVAKSKEKYQTALRNHQITKVANQQRLDLSAKNCAQLKIQVDHLNKELQFKIQQLKDVKGEAQHLIQHSGKRQDEATQCLVRGEQLRGANDMLKIEEQRIRSQITVSKEEIERQRKQNTNINKSLQTVKDKCYKTQSYIRNLAREQNTLNQSLAKIQDQNNYLDNRIAELTTVQSLAEGKVSQVDKENQEQKFLIASKELEIKKLQKQIKQAAKTLLQERQKTKILNEQLQQKKASLNRIENEVRQCSDEINFIMARNSEVSEVNLQLKSDLKVCEKHLDNVTRQNKNIESELSKFKEVNLAAIKKLQEPFRQNSNGLFPKTTPRKFSETARMTATGGFDKDFSI